MFASASLDHLLILLFLALICWAALRDAMAFRIPNWVSAGILLLYPLHVLASDAAIDWHSGLLTFGLVFLAGFVVFAKGICGGGDVKLLSAAALWAGTTLLFPLLMVMALTGGVLSGAALLSRNERLRRDPERTLSTADTHVPYGMAISFGAALVGLHLLTA